jgi:DNA-binding MurR/RpiR family transcriptional regulator
VASYLAYVFDKLGVPAVLHDGVAGLGHRSILQPGDALLAITFAPYSEETLALAAHARDRDLPVVVLTDPAASPLAGLADTILTVTEIDFGAFRSLSAVIALVCRSRSQWRRGGKLRASPTRVNGINVP